MALHENFNEYTDAEITKIKEKVCIKNNCPYLGYESASSGVNKTCNYILYTGKARRCMPDDCKHYTDKGVKRRHNFTEGDNKY